MLGKYGGEEMLCLRRIEDRDAQPPCERSGRVWPRGLPNCVQGSQGRIQNLVIDNLELQSGGRLTTRRIGSSPVIVVFKAYQNIKALCLSFRNPEHWAGYREHAARSYLINLILYATNQSTSLAPSYIFSFGKIQCVSALTSLPEAFTHEVFSPCLCVSFTFR